EARLAGFPREVEWIHGDAMPAQARTGIERHEPEGLRGGRVDHFPDVDVHLGGHEGNLVHEADVDAAERVFEELHHLGDLRARHRYDLVHDLGVERHGRARAVRRASTDDLRDVPG